MTSSLVLAALTTVGLMLERRFAPSATTPASESAVAIGTRAPALDAIRYEDAAQTLLIVTRSTCTFCEQSAPFWQRVIDERRRANTTLRIVAVSDDPQRDDPGLSQSSSS